MKEAAASTSFVISSNTARLFRFPRKPIVAMPGTSSCNSSSPLAPEFTHEDVEARQVASRPIETCNKPKLHGSLPTLNTIGMLVVLALAARVATSPDETMAATRSLDQIGRQRRQAVILAMCKAIFDGHVWP